MNKEERRMAHLVTQGVWADIKTYDSRVHMGDEMIDFLFERLPKGSWVLEFGSGESTARLVERYNVVTVESDERWLNKVSAARYIHAPLKPFFSKELNREIPWYSRQALLDGLPDHDVDAIIVDGPDGEFARYGIARYYRFLGLKSQTPIMVDDMQQPFVYMTALMLAKKNGLYHMDINITKDQRVFGWLEQ